MQTTWIVVADSSRARIFEKTKSEPHLREIEDFVNPAGHANDNDLRTDERGRFYGRGERKEGNTADPHVFPVDQENEVFSRAITQYLDSAHYAHRYQRLRLIAAPKFLGLIRKNLSKEIFTIVDEEASKDISKFTVEQVENYINK